MRLRPRTNYLALIRTSCGNFRIDLLEETAPETVNNFVFLARKGFYDGLTWHEVSADFIIQAGDPNGDNGVEPDGPGYFIRDELPSDADSYVYGAVGMANAGRPDSAGSQFFVIVHDFPGAAEGKPKPLKIDVEYSIFGQVPSKYFGVLEAIARQDVQGGSDPVESLRPVRPVYLLDVRIVEKV